MLDFKGISQGFYHFNPYQRSYHVLSLTLGSLTPSASSTKSNSGEPLRASLGEGSMAGGSSSLSLSPRFSHEKWWFSMKSPWNQRWKIQWLSFPLELGACGALPRFSLQTACTQSIERQSQRCFRSWNQGFQEDWTKTRKSTHHLDLKIKIVEQLCHERYGVLAWSWPSNNTLWMVFH